jgi:hypothetical protein
MKVFRNGAFGREVVEVVECRKDGPFIQMNAVNGHPKTLSDGCEFAAQLKWVPGAGPIGSDCGVSLGRASENLCFLGKFIVLWNLAGKI